MQERDHFRASTSSDFAAELSCVRALSAMLSPVSPRNRCFHQWAVFNTVQNQEQGEIRGAFSFVAQDGLRGGLKEDCLEDDGPRERDHIHQGMRRCPRQYAQGSRKRSSDTATA